MPTKKHTSGTPKDGKAYVKLLAFTLNRMIGGLKSTFKQPEKKDVDMPCPS
jgi:hypothetical protein